MRPITLRHHQKKNMETSRFILIAIFFLLVCWIVV